MASAKQFHLFFLVVLFSSASLQIHARDSQFFSKFTRVDTAAASNNDGTNSVNKSTSSNADNVKEIVGVLPKKETPVAEAPLESKQIPASSGNKKEEKPNKEVQETSNSGYGLYGHGSGQFPPTTTENDNNDALDAMTYSELPDEENFSEEEFSTTTPADTSEGGAMDQSKTTKDGYPYYNNNNGYEGKQVGLADAQFATDNVDKNHYHNYDNRQNHDEQQLERQGMSDTRFLENGKYYYHVQAVPNVNTHNDEYYKHTGGAEFIDHSAVQEEQNEGNQYRVADKNANSYNGYEGTQLGLSDAQFSTDNVNNNQNYEQQIEKQGMSDTRFVQNGQRYGSAAVNNNNYNYNNNKHRPIERQGMSDTRFQENGRYYNAAANSNDNSNNMYQQGERQGMSDTRFLANGKYYYHVEAANPNVNTHNDEYSRHIDGAEFIDHSADSSRFNNQQQQQHTNNGGYYNYGTSNNNGNSFDRQYSNNNGNSFDRQYSNSNSNYYPVDQEMNNNGSNSFDDDNQLGPQGEYIP